MLHLDVTLKSEVCRMMERKEKWREKTFCFILTVNLTKQEATMLNNVSREVTAVCKQSSDPSIASVLERWILMYLEGAGN